jgi:hypothetical protein
VVISEGAEEPGGPPSPQAELGSAGEPSPPQAELGSAGVGGELARGVEVGGGGEVARRVEPEAIVAPAEVGGDPGGEGPVLDVGEAGGDTTTGEPLRSASSAGGGEPLPAEAP